MSEKNIESFGTKFVPIFFQSKGVSNARIILLSQIMIFGHNQWR